MKLTRLTLTLFLNSMLVLTACTREVAVTNHNAAIEVEPVVFAPQGEPATTQELAAIDPEALQARLGQRGLNASTVDATQAEAVLKELEPVMLYARYIENPRYNATGRLRRSMQVWNIALLSLMQTNRSAVDREGNDYLNRYVRVILSGCNEDLQGCVNIGFFRQDPGSARVIEEMARRQDSAITSSQTPEAKSEALRLYYKYLLVSFDLRNKVTNQEFDFLYMNRAAEYAEFFRSAGAAAAGNQNFAQSSRMRSALQRHREIFEMLLNGFNPDMSRPEFRARIERFVNNFRPWNYSRREENLFGVGATKMMSLAATHFMYTTPAGQTPGQATGQGSPTNQRTNHLNPSLRQAIEESQREDGAEPSFTKNVQRLQSSEANLVRNLELVDDIPRDEYFFIVDRLFRDHLSPDDASAIWLSTRRDSSRLLKTLESYLKFEMAWMIVRTNRFMGDVYGNRGSYTGNGLLKHAVESSYTISNEWISIVAKIERIKIFVNRHMRNADDSIQTTEFGRVDKMLTELGRNIKFVSVYPNMMLMMYFMEMVDGKLTIYTWFGPIELDTNVVINAFLSGYIPPFFRFGNDNSPLSKLEITYAFYFALKTDTFKTFAADGKNDVDETKFFEKVIGKFLADETRDLTRAADRLRDEFSQSESYPTFLRMCAQDKLALEQGRGANTQGDTLPIDLDKFMQSTYMGAAESTAKTALAFYTGIASANGDVQAGPLSTFRDGLRTKMTVVETMLQVFERHLETSGVSAEVRSQTLGRIRSNFNRLEHEKTRVLTDIVRRHREISDCMNQSTKIEWDRQHQLIKREEAHLRDAWCRMQKERDANATCGQGAARPVADLFKDYPSVASGDPVPAGFVSDGSITKDEYIYSQVDVLLRLRGYMREIAPRVTIRLPNELTVSDLWKKPSRASLSANLTEEQFVRRGLLMLNGTGATSFVKWIPETNSLIPHIAKMQLVTELYRLGEFDVYNVEEAACRTQPAPPTCKVKASISATQALKEISDTIRLLSLTNPERSAKDVEMLNLLSLTSRYKKDELKRMFLNEHDQGRTLLEILFKSLAEDTIADEEARSYFSTTQAEGHFMFSVNNDFKRIMRRNYRPMLLNSYRVTEGFIAAVRSLEQADKQAGQILNFGFELRNGEITGITPALENGSPVYLNRMKIGEFEARKRMFRDSTQRRFDACPSDPEFQQGASFSHCGGLTP